MVPRLDGARHAPMRDNRDGTFTAAIPTEWIHRTGTYTFHFEHNGQELFPIMKNQLDPAIGHDCKRTTLSRGAGEPVSPSRLVVLH